MSVTTHLVCKIKFCGNFMWVRESPNRQVRLEWKQNLVVMNTFQKRGIATRPQPPPGGDTRFSVLRLTGHTEPGAIVNTHSGMSIVWLEIFYENLKSNPYSLSRSNPCVLTLGAGDTQCCVHSSISKLTGLHNISVILLLTKLPFLGSH